MKIIPEQTTTSLIHSSDQGLKLEDDARREKKTRHTKK